MFGVYGETLKFETYFYQKLRRYIEINHDITDSIFDKKKYSAIHLHQIIYQNKIHLHVKLIQEQGIKYHFKNDKKIYQNFVYISELLTGIYL
jgi:hypothetical protein